MMTDKEQERFMSREEVKLRKWGRRQRNFEELIETTEAYLQEAESPDKKLYFQRVKVILSILKERADAHHEKWVNKMKEKQKEVKA